MSALQNPALALSADTWPVGLRFGTRVVSSLLCNALSCYSKVTLLWRCCILVKPPLGVGDASEFLPCKGISVRRVWHRTPCPELKINRWLKSGSNPVRSSFPFSTRIGWRWPWVANFWKPSVAQFFLNLSDLGSFLSFVSYWSMSDLLTVTFS